MSITNPGFYPGLNEAEYHADPVPDGSLSYSGMKLILDCPAVFHHQQTTPRPANPSFDFGHIVHALVLGQPLNAVELPFADFRKKEAQEARDTVRAQGLIPLRQGELAEPKALAEAVLADVQARPLFEAEGECELSMFDVHESGAWIRGRIDKLSSEHKEPVLVDLKTCTDANPDAFGRDIQKFKYWLQAAVYTSLYQGLSGGERPQMKFVAVSKKPPFLVSVNTVSPTYYWLGDQKRDEAITTWLECRESGIWPGYPRPVQHEPPAWILPDDEDLEF